MKPVTPLLTVDAIILIDDKVLLIERKNEPLGWALPGGFVDVGETVENALKREVKEEVSLDVTDMSLFGVYSDPSRDSRGHTVSIVYHAQTTGQAAAADDAKAVKLFGINELPENIAFDYSTILSDFIMSM